MVQEQDFLHSDELPWLMVICAAECSIELVLTDGSVVAQSEDSHIGRSEVHTDSTMV